MNKPDSTKGLGRLPFTQEMLGSSPTSGIGQVVLSSKIEYEAEGTGTPSVSCRHRLTVKTVPCQGTDMGSIPVVC